MGWRIIVQKDMTRENGITADATIRVRVGDTEMHTAAQGGGGCSEPGAPQGPSELLPRPREPAAPGLQGPRAQRR